MTSSDAETDSKPIIIIIIIIIIINAAQNNKTLESVLESIALSQRAHHCRGIAPLNSHVQHIYIYYIFIYIYTLYYNK